MKTYGKGRGKRALHLKVGLALFFWILGWNCIVDDEGDTHCRMGWTHVVEVWCESPPDDDRVFGGSDLKPDKDFECQWYFWRW